MKQVNFKFPVRMLAIMLGLFLSVNAFAQQVAVKGNVVDDTGEPVIGASVRVEGTTATIAVTDFDGNFSVNVPQGSKLSVTYMGFQTAVVAAAPSVKIQLKPDETTLSDVVVIGYGRAKKEDLTGAVIAMKPDDLSKGITNNASDMLVGKIAGVDVQTSGGTPGAGAQIRIRGGASLSASNDPLYVIDGLPIDNNTATGMSDVLAMIAPGDIETFTVLKDASATAIYGSRASNGVIMITTKKGRAGSAPKVTYNGDVTVSMIQKKYDVLNASEYKSLVNSIDGLDASTLGTADTNWQDEIFRTAISTSHNVSIAGGLKNMPYRVSAGYNISNGIVKTSWMRRTNASLNLAPSFLNNHLQFNITAKYMYEKDSYAEASGAIGAALEFDPTRPVKVGRSESPFTDGFYQVLISTSSFSDTSWNQTINDNAPQNPVALLRQKRCIANSNDFSGNIDMDYKIHGFEDLHIHASLGAQYTATDQRDTTSKYSYNNNYYGWDGMTYYWKYNIVGNVYAQYQHEFGAHNVDIMAGAEDSHYHRTGYNVGQGTDYYTGDSYNPSVRSETEWAVHNSLVSYFARLNYGLLDRYMLTATFRADGSSRFSKDNRWGYFPAVALAWKINNEPFLRNVSWIDELKLRLGWGKTGQQNGIDEFYYLPLYVQSNSYAQYPFGNTYYNTQRPKNYNTDLTWEKTTTYNVGIDYSMLNGRFSATLEGYYRKTSDLLATVPIPAMTNFGDQQLRNIGSLENYGLEASFNVKPIVTKDFTWDISYNVGWNHNEVTELSTGSADYVTVTSNTISAGNNTTIQRNAVGHPINSFYVYQQVYDENGKPIEGMFVDRNADGKIDSSDGYYYKSPNADVIMGLTMKFLWKRWDLSMAFHASLGNYVYYDYLSRNARLSASGLNYNSAWRNIATEAVSLGWTKQGTTTANENYMSDYFVRNASYLKCTNITLGYSFPALLKYAGKDYFSGRVYLTAQNPFMITKYDGLDPEVSSGVDKNPYPRPMSFQLGLNLNF